MPHSIRLGGTLGCMGMVLLARAASGAGLVMDLEVSVMDLPRQLVRAAMRIPCDPAGGAMDLRYVIWSPGNHTPSGPIENLVDLVVRDCRGARLEWDRDATQVERFSIVTPPGCEAIEVSLSYIASQPNANSRSTDTYGKPSMGVLNWNTVLLYPGGASNQEVLVDATLVTPSDWSFATSLRSVERAEERFGALRDLDPGRAVRVTTFERVPLAELVDAPVIMGANLTSHTLDMTGIDGPPHVLHVAGAEAAHTKVPDWLLRDIAETCRQTILLFPRRDGRVFPRDRYEFLVTVDETMRFGVEHGESTLIGLPTKAFLDAKESEFLGGGGAMTVLPHEHFHAWCGKLLAPEGLVRPDFSTPVVTDLLWVYEGLTTYYDSVLAVRGGMTTFEEFKHEILTSAVALEQRSGRLWRSVEDTARAARHLRQRGLYWYDARRGQEYYGEGAKFWMEADAIIRTSSGGAKSLDDFCASFFDVPINPVGAQATYTRADVVKALHGLAPGTDWDALIRARIEEPVESLDMGPLLKLVGWKIEYADEPTAAQSKFEPEGTDLNLRTSLGLRVNKDGEVIDLVPGSPADEAGLAYGMKVLAAGGWEYAPARLKDAVKATPETKGIDFVVSFGGRVSNVRVAYEHGPRIPRLVRFEGTMDLLERIAQPR